MSGSVSAADPNNSPFILLALTATSDLVVPKAVTQDAVDVDCSSDIAAGNDPQDSEQNVGDSLPCNVNTK